jgi:beta-phosphoglucomutase-like phosphatase (HAD superfamily)
MSTDLDTLTDSERLALSALSEAFDTLVGDIIDARTYGGPDAHMHAQNQAQREMSQALVALVRAKREESVPC